MSESPVEEKPKKSRKKKILLTVLILLLIPLVAAGIYLYSLNQAWSQAERITDTSPNEDGSVAAPHSEELQKIIDEAAGEITTGVGEDGHEATADLQANITDEDANGNGVPDDQEKGQTTGRPAETGATDILLIGSDSRAGTADAATVSGQRADTLMILHIPQGGGEAYLISVMRDTWTNIPGYGMAKVNAGLNYGGVALQVATIEQLTGVRIDHVAEVDFQGFKGLVDAIGGVTVQVPFSFSADPYTFTQGPQTMTGGEALVFVRQRYQFADGDYQRVRNQRAFLRGFINTVKGQGALENIAEFRGMVNEISPYLTIDEGLTVTEMVSLAAPFITSGNTHIHMMTLPNAGTGWSADGQSIVVNSTAATSQLAAAYQSGDMASFFATYGED